MSKSAVIFGRDLGFAYRKPSWLFRGLSFSLAAGDILAVLGPNGCGKSTLLDILLGVRQPLCGEIVKRQACCFVPQFFSPPFAYSVSDIVLMGRATHINLFSTPKAADRRIAREALHSLGLLDLAARDFATLSGGQKQMVLIARALAAEAPIMLLDEPASALDLYHQNRLLSLLHRLAEERKLTVIFTTHQPNHAELLANKTLLLRPDHSLFGDTRHILNRDNLSALFHLPMLHQCINVQQAAFRHFVPVYDVALKKR